MLNRVRHYVDKLKGMVNNTNFINSPITGEIKECCIKSALECFRSKVLFLNGSNIKKSQTIINSDLRKPAITKTVSICSQKEIQEAQCKSCDSYPKVDSRTFMQNFQTLLQKIFVRLLVSQA
ncbi:interleukin-21-like isoform X2 [Myxocyprinus asiaticus]|nr:interleukin-21-like isoform X2 [Myxocyprinus asiaticus]XP_051506513.1 interleukin-21-like isoform X2 [Myxocyprinus asiaticus]